MYIKVTAKGINQFIDEDNTRKIKHMKDDFGAEVEMDASGKVKRYTADQVRAYVGKHNTKDTPETIFGVKSNTTNTSGTTGTNNNKGN